MVNPFFLAEPPIGLGRQNAPNQGFPSPEKEGKKSFIFL